MLTFEIKQIKKYVRDIHRELSLSPHRKPKLKSFERSIGINSILRYTLNSV